MCVSARAHTCVYMLFSCVVLFQFYQHMYCRASIIYMYIHEEYKYMNNCERSELSSAFNGPEVHFIFQVDRHSVNVLHVYKYPPNAIFRSAKMHKRDRLNELAQSTTAATYVEHAFARPMLASY